MSDALVISLTFVLVMTAFAAIGVLSVRQSRGTVGDYYLASRSIKPWLAGLSAVATNNSGYMFIGLMGYTYAAGLSSLWLMFGWIVGDYIASRRAHRWLREQSIQSGALTFSAVLASWPGHDRQWHVFRIVAAVITLAFMLPYASAQLLAGGKALHALIDWPVWSGAVLSAGLVAAYCLAGGIRASIWTDAAQSTVMLLAMATMLISAIFSLGGVSGALEKLHAVDGYMLWFPADLPLQGLGGMGLFVIGWLFAGASVIGQPHIMVRFMAVDDARHMGATRMWYYAWFTAFYGLAASTALLARVLLGESVTFDAELALPAVALQLLHPVGVGFVLAGIFAASMSTADSLILSSSASIVRDFKPDHEPKPWQWKVTTAFLTLVALFIALEAESSVFNLVVLSWSGLASAFAPLLLVLVAGGKPSQIVALLMMISGVIAAVLWRATGLHEYFYEGMPGILVGLVVYLASCAVQKMLVPKPLIFQGER